MKAAVVGLDDQNLGLGISDATSKPENSLTYENTDIKCFTDNIIKRVSLFCHIHVAIIACFTLLSLPEKSLL
jgi:hypothetical protein